MTLRCRGKKQPGSAEQARVTCDQASPACRKGRTLSSERASSAESAVEHPRSAPERPARAELFTPPRSCIAGIELHTAEAPNGLAPNQDF